MKNKNELDRFIKAVVQMEKFVNEFTALSKKNPNDAVNKFKLKLINQILLTSNKIIDKKNKPFPDFEKFSEEELPTNSDALIILSQYLGCLHKFRRENTIYNDHKYWWVIGGRISSVEAPHPDYSILKKI